MTPKLRNKLKDYPNVLEMFSNIPENLWDIFWPKNDREKFLLESRILLLKIREPERNEVMGLQKQCELPLHPNQPITETASMARIRGNKKGKILRKYRKDRHDGGGPIK